jgi:glutathione S-transferase
MSGFLLAASLPLVYGQQRRSPVRETEMMELEIIGVPYSNYVRSIRMLCEEKGVAYKLTLARPHSPEVTVIHPAGQVPCLRHGALELFESLAIAFYIDKAFPGRGFFPGGAVEGARVLQWISYVNAKVDRWIMREFVVPSVFFDKTKGPDTVKIAAAQPEIEKCLAVLERAVAKTGFLAGDDLTFADINVLPILTVFQQFPQGRQMTEGYPNLSAYVGKLAARPSFANTAPPPRG